MTELNLFNITKMADAEKLAKIADDYAAMSATDNLYNGFMKQATEAAEHGVRSIQIPMMRESSFRYMYEAMKMRGMLDSGVDQDAYCAEQHDAQNKLIDKLKSEKFKVSVKEMSGLIIPGEQRERNEDIESIVTVEW